jgi:Pyridine nucleotide-disulphide oxidoreductase
VAAREGEALARDEVIRVERLLNLHLLRRDVLLRARLERTTAGDCRERVFALSHLSILFPSCDHQTRRCRRATQEESGGRKSLPQHAASDLLNRAGGEIWGPRARLQEFDHDEPARGGALTSEGSIETDEHQRTSVPGVWAIGDVVDALDQMAVAIGHAAIATTDVHNSLTASIKPEARFMSR